METLRKIFQVIGEQPDEYILSSNNLHEIGYFIQAIGGGETLKMLAEDGEEEGLAIQERIKGLKSILDNSENDKDNTVHA